MLSAESARRRKGRKPLRRWTELMKKKEGEEKVGRVVRQKSIRRKRPRGRERTTLRKRRREDNDPNYHEDNMLSRQRGIILLPLTIKKGK